MRFWHFVVPNSHVGTNKIEDSLERWDQNTRDVIRCIDTLIAEIATVYEKSSANISANRYLPVL